MVIKGDTRSLDYGSLGDSDCGVLLRAVGTTSTTAT